MAAARGRFGAFGGRYVPETLAPALDELAAAWSSASRSRAFRSELRGHLRSYAGRPTPLYYAERLTARAGGARIYLKREDLLHGGAHKINNALGQALLARRMGKRRVIAETGAGQHGVATAMACSRLGLRAEVYMGARDAARQEPNVFRMGLLGAAVRRVGSGGQTLRAAVNEAIRDWISSVRGTHYLLGSAVGPHPYPEMVRGFQRVIGDEIAAQSRREFGGPPDAAVACVGGGSNAIGTFYPLLGTGARLWGVEAAGRGLRTGRHSASLAAGRPGILHGMMTYVLQDGGGQVREAHSISAGLDYPAVGPEHAALRESGRVRYTSATDAEAVAAFLALSADEGILPALESAHAVAAAMRLARRMPRSARVVVTLSGRGDKDVGVVGGYLRAGGRARRG